MYAVVPSKVKLTSPFMVPAVPVNEEEKEKYPIPNQKGKFYEWRMDMTTLKMFTKRDYIEALSYIGVLPE